MRWWVMEYPWSHTLNVVRVVMAERVAGECPSTQLWLAAVLREDAVQAVQRRIPAQWTAELTDYELTSEQVLKLKLLPGDVFELPFRR